MFSGLGEQLISGSYVFGISAIAFSLLPFLFIIIKAIIDGKKEQTSGVDVIGTFLMAFLVHTVSCISFMTTIKVMDIIGSSYSNNYLQDKVFKIFWTFDKASVFSIAGTNGTVEAEGAYIILYATQIVVQFALAFIPLIVIFLGAVYGILQAKKDVFRADILSSSVWTILATIVAVMLYFLWAKIATVALFMPDGKDLVQFINEIWVKIIQT